jgi:hypothetical protein
MKKTKRVLLWVAAFTAGFALSASAALADTIDDAVKVVGDYVASGHYTEAAIIAIIGLVAAFRKWAPRQWPFWRSDVGGSLLVLLMAFGASLAAAISGSGGFEWSMLWSAFKLAALSSGGYTLIKRLGGALISKLPIPGWAQKALNAALWLFQPRGADAVAKAEKAGERAASEANTPGAGSTGMLP